MKRELMIVNAVIVVALIGAGFQLRTAWRDFDTTHDVSGIQFEGEALSVPTAVAGTEASPVEDWNSVSDQNLFSFDRNDIAIGVGETEPIGPRPVLFGTMSLGGEPLAMLAAPGDRAYRSVKVGETINGWTLVEIRDKSVVLSAGGSEEAVNMNDPTAAVPREARRTMARSAPPPQVSTVQPAPAPVTATTLGSSRGTPGRGVTVQTPTGPVSEDNVPPGFRIMKTPFGNVLVRNPGQ